MLRLIALLLLLVSPVDEIAARLDALERESASLRLGQSQVIDHLLRSGRARRDAADWSAIDARLQPGNLDGIVRTRGGVDRTPALAQPLMQRLTDDGTLGGLAAGRTDTYDGYANMLAEPAFETLYDPAALTTSYASIGQDWEAKYVLNSGTVATTRNMGAAANRGDTGLTFLSSGLCALALVFGVNAADMTIYLRPITAPVMAAGFNLDPSWLVASIRAFTYAASNVTATAYMQIVDTSDNVLAEGDVEDLVNLYTLSEQAALAVGYDAADANVQYRFRLRIDVTKTAGSAASLTAFLAEPLLAFSNDGSVPAYTPSIGAWKPGFPGRQLVAHDFVYVDIPAGATTELLPSDNNMLLGGVPRIAMPWTGSIIGASYRLSGAPTAGTITPRITVAGTNVWSPWGALGTGATTGDTAKQDPGTDTFNVGDGLGVDIVATGGFTPATRDILVVVWVLVDIS